MAKIKTEFATEDVHTFINSLENEQKKNDAFKLMELMENATGEKARMFGPTIIGFGQYHYKYASGHEGDAPLLAFSPRKAAISLYVTTGSDEQKLSLIGLGKYKMAKACLSVKRLEDINLEILERLMKETIDFVSNKYERVKAK